MYHSNATYKTYQVAFLRCWTSLSLLQYSSQHGSRCQVLLLPEAKPNGHDEAQVHYLRAHLHS